MSRVIDEHRQYLQDGVRLDCFRRAIEGVVKPGDVVLDLGAGTGVLGMFACRAGASHVYVIESTALIGVTRELYRRNGFGDRATFIKSLSLHTDLPERVDVVVGDQIGGFGFEAGVFDYYADARRRLLKPGGVTIPCNIELHVAAVESDEASSRLRFWDTSPGDLDFRPARAIASNTGYPIKFERSDLLTDGLRLAALDPTEPVPLGLRKGGSLTALRAGTLHGIIGFFKAELGAGVWLTNSPLAEERITRRNIFFPIDEPVPVAEGDVIDVQMQFIPSQHIVGWDVAVRAPGEDKPKARFRHSTFEGMLVCKEDLERLTPDHVPQLTPRGEGRLTVLNLCDGRPLREVEDGVFERHPNLFTSRDEAAVFVAEVITVYST